jgi:thioredoxin-related protein
MNPRSLIRTLALSWTLGLVVGAGLASAQGSGAPAPKALALGSTIPMADAKMKNVDGKEMTLAAAQGKKGTLVVFSCNACPWAKKWESRIVALGNDYSKKGVGVVVVNSNDPKVNAEDGYDVMVTRAKQRGMKFAYVEDATSDVARAFGATRTPEAFLFDASGKLVYHGTIDDNADDAKAVKNKYLENALASVTAGKSVTVAETKSLGCGIKFRGSKAS